MASLSSAAYAAGWGLTQHLPERVVSGTFRLAADGTVRRGGSGVDQLRANLRRARPTLSADELDDLVRDAMRSYLRYWQEAFRLPTWSRAEVKRRIKTTNAERLIDPLEAGIGVIVVLGHFGNWDHAGAWITGEGYGLTTVAERLRPEALYERFVTYRESLGMEVLGLGDRELSTVLQQRLEQGGLVALLADRDITGTGTEVTLLGEPARLPAGPALLSMRTRSVLLPATSYYDGPNTQVRFELPLTPQTTTQGSSLREQVRDLTQQWADVIGQAAVKHSRDWHMLQPVWSADFPRRSHNSGPHNSETETST